MSFIFIQLHTLKHGMIFSMYVLNDYYFPIWIVFNQDIQVKTQWILNKETNITLHYAQELKRKDWRKELLSKLLFERRRLCVRLSVCLSAKIFFVQNGSNSQIRWTDISNSRIQARRAWFLVSIIKFFHFFDWTTF